MKYIEPEMEIFKFEEVAADLDIVGGASSGNEDSSDTEGEW